MRRGRERKFILLNNGCSEVRGHYLETSLSIAEEARNRGFQVVLGTHVAYTAGDCPEWIEPYPIFRVDHYGRIAENVPSVPGVRGNVRAWQDHPFDAVLSGRQSLAEHLHAHLEPSASLARGTSLRGLLSRLRSTLFGKRFARPTPPESPDSAARRETGFLKQFSPPVLLPVLRPMYFFLRARRLCDYLPPLFSHWMSVRSLASKPPIEAIANRLLIAAQAEQELAAYQVFAQDLHNLLCMSGACAGDVVFLPTAHGREALAIRQLIADLPEDRAPSFHLEFRHAVHAPHGDPLVKEDYPWVAVYSRIHDCFFTAFRAAGATPRIRFWTDTEELARDYGLLSGLPFDVLPIPFRERLIPPTMRREGPLTILYLGDGRDEKGFHFLADLVVDVLDDCIRPGRARFVIQASIPDEHSTPSYREVLRRLESYPTSQVELIGQEGFVRPEDYYRRLAQADVVLCPYRSISYRARSSGIFTEALWVGTPTVAPADSWLARQQPEGAGETCSDRVSLAEAVRKILFHHPRYAERALAAREAWRNRHTPARLLSCLLTESGNPQEAAA